MLLQKIIGRIVYTEIPADRLALNIGIVSVPLDLGRLKILHADAIAAECTLVSGKHFIQSLQVLLIDNDCTQQHHEERCLCVALSDSVTEHLRCGNCVVLVIAEQDLIPDIIIDALNLVEIVKLLPSLSLYQLLYLRCRIVQNGCLPQVFILPVRFFHLFPSSVWLRLPIASSAMSLPGV